MNTFEQGGVMPGPMVRRECPLSTCTWVHNEEPLPADSRQWPGYGTVPLAELGLHAIRYVTAKTEAALEQHLGTHTVVEWATELAAVRSELAAAKARTRFGGFEVVEAEGAPPGSITLVPASPLSEQENPDDVVDLPVKRFAVAHWGEDS